MCLSLRRNDHVHKQKTGPEHFLGHCGGGTDGPVHRRGAGFLAVFRYGRRAYRGGDPPDHPAHQVPEGSGIPGKDQYRSP